MAARSNKNNNTKQTDNRSTFVQSIKLFFKFDKNIFTKKNLEIVLIIFSLLGGIPTLWFFWDKIFPPASSNSNFVITNNYTNPTLKDTLVEQATKIVLDYFDFDSITILDPGVVRAALFDPNKLTEFYLCYRLNDIESFLDVFTIKHGSPENIFHKSFRAVDILPGHFMFENRPYFVYGLAQGSGGFLDINIYEYDGLSKLKVVYDKLDAFFGGSFTANENGLFVSGGNSKYVLVKSNGKFHFKKTKHKLTYEIGSATHILSYDVINDSLNIFIDGEKINFYQENSDSFTSVKEFNFKYFEQIIEDNNLPSGAEGHSIRILVSSDEFKFHRAFYLTLVPLVKGSVIIHISYEYNLNYYLRIKII